MASGTRSSKRKSSPSIRKKRRIKDRTKKRSKTLKGKSKKVSRRESPDSYSESESLSSASSVSYSSSDTDSRRSRSRIRKDSKKKSRGSRVRSKSIDNNVNERRVKRSKKGKGTDAKKKSLRKKRKREPSISSRSVSCSTCRSSDDSEGENQKTEKRMKRGRRDLDDYKRWGGHRSRSCSPCRLDGVDGSYLRVEQRLVENNPRRLRSIIIVAKEFEEEEETELIDRDVHKEEIIYDQDDYPSPRSNDSNELQVQHGKNVGSKVEHDDVITSNSDQAMVLGSVEVSEAKVSSADAGSNPTDLEAVLRQKALENLKKFKGGMRPSTKKPIGTKNSIDGELKQSSSTNANLELLKKDLEGNVGCTMGESSALNGAAAKILPILTQDSKTVNPSKDGSDVEKLEGGVGKVSVLKEGDLKVDSLPEQALPTQETPLINMPNTESLLLPSRNGKGLSDSVDSIKDKRETVSLQRLGSHKLDSSMIPIEEASMTMSVLTKCKDIVESVHPSNDAKLVSNDTEKTPTEAVDKTISNLEGQSSNAQGKEGDSQFQQKTMSVMRGGEMVQVNYKVYIPKNAPALARRKLKR